jgi:hypothetical protein
MDYSGILHFLSYIQFQSIYVDLYIKNLYLIFE